MANLQIRKENGKAKVYTPYNSDFVKAIRQVGGAKWNPADKCWETPESAVDAIRRIMTKVYGHSDISEDETMTLKVTFTEARSTTCDAEQLFGKVLARAFGKTSGAKIGDDVAYISGGATSGGSVKNWQSIVEEGSVAILSNVSKALYEKDKDAEGIVIEIMDGKPDRAQLLAEKERLLKRLAEIEKMLND